MPITGYFDTATLNKVCECGTGFATRSRIRERCDTCRAIAEEQQQKKANAKLKARRLLRRNGGLPRASVLAIIK